MSGGVTKGEGVAWVQWVESRGLKDKVKRPLDVAQGEDTQTYKRPNSARLPLILGTGKSGHSSARRKEYLNHLANQASLFTQGPAVFHAG